MPRTVPFPSDCPPEVEFYSSEAYVETRINEGDLTILDIPNAARRVSQLAYSVRFVHWNYNEARVNEIYEWIINWAAENNIKLVSRAKEYNYRTYVIPDGRTNNVRVNMPWYFNLCEPRTSDRGYPFPATECECGHENYTFAIQCAACNKFRYCIGCGRWNEGNWDTYYGTTACRNCATECDNCGQYKLSSMCSSCNPAFRCYSCGDLHAEDDVIELDGEQYCDGCANHLCRECHVIDYETQMSDEMICVRCESKKHNEDHDEEAEMQATKLAIPAIPGRELIRYCGVEIEGGNGESGNDAGQDLAYLLYSNGLSDFDSAGRYHSGNNVTGKSHNYAHVERDSSVDWEMVIGPLNMARIEDVRALNKSVKLLRQMIREGQAKLDMRAGLHVHVEAKNAKISQAYNLHILYLFLEDFLYRLAAAKWPYHRAIPRKGEGAARKNPVRVGKVEFARTYASDRYYGLSFENYFQQHLQKCRCGAKLYGAYEECTCNLQKCTFEFRLFNTTANTTKIHAYLALCQALVAKALELDEIKDIVEYPALDFVPKKVADMTESELSDFKDGWMSRLEWVANELPLTKEEKASLYYCVVNSEMGPHVENASMLLAEMEDN